MLLASLESTLNTNQTVDHFQSFVNFFLQSHMHSTYSTKSFTDSLALYTLQVNHPAQNAVSTFFSSWLTQPGLPLLSVYPYVNDQNEVTAIAFAQKQFLLNSQRHVPSHFMLTLTINQKVVVHISKPTKTVRLTTPIPLSQLSITLSPYLPAVAKVAQVAWDGERLKEMTSGEILREVRSCYLLVRQGTDSVDKVWNDDSYH